jgi:hypothetical protein
VAPERRRRCSFHRHRTRLRLVLSSRGASIAGAERHPVSLRPRGIIPTSGSRGEKIAVRLWALHGVCWVVLGSVAPRDAGSFVVSSACAGCLCVPAAGFSRRRQPGPERSGRPLSDGKRRFWIDSELCSCPACLSVVTRQRDSCRGHSRTEGRRASPSAVGRTACSPLPRSHRASNRARNLILEVS